MAKDNNHIKDAVEKVKQHGYRVRRSGKYVKVSLIIHEDTLKGFKDASKQLDYRLQESATEALDMWCEAKAPELESKKRR